jgi:hypothetical protein
MSAFPQTTSPRPSREHIAQALVAESALDMQDETGGTFEVWTIACDGDMVNASAPRLQVQDGMTMTAEVLVDGLPYAVAVRVERADYRSETRASLKMRVTQVEPAGARRGEERVELTGSGNLHALAATGYRTGTSSAWRFPTSRPVGSDSERTMSA